MSSLGGLVRNWKRRWFVITDGCLFYYESRIVRALVDRHVTRLINHRSLGSRYTSWNHSSGGRGRS